MLLPRILRAASRLQSLPPSAPSLTSHFLLPSLTQNLKNANARIPPTSISSPTLTFVRYATHKMSRAANGPRSPAGRRLGLKRAAGEFVKIGMIIFRQKGTLWYPGENVGMGRDHTIFAMQPGYVRYYNDPKQPERKFIGVALHIDQPLPRPLNAARVRRLGFDVQELTKEEVFKFDKAERSTAVDDDKMVGWVTPQGTYQPRMTGWRIGQFMDRGTATLVPKNRRGWIRMRKKRENKEFKGARQLIEAQAEQPKKARNVENLKAGFGARGPGAGGGGDQRKK